MDLSERHSVRESEGGETGNDWRGDKSREKKTRNEKKTDKTRDEGNQDSQRRVNSLGIGDPLCQQFGDMDFSTVTARGERGRTRCFHYRWRRV